MKPHVEQRPKTEATERVVLALVYAVRDQLYRDEQKAAFYGQLKDLKRAVTWPAQWFHKRGIFVSPERYQAILMNLLLEIRRKGDTGAIQYWPRYLLTCIQQHFIHQGETYYEEGKAARDLVTRITAKIPVRPAAEEPADHFTRTLAQTHALLRSPGGRKKAKTPPLPQQQTLL